MDLSTNHMFHDIYKMVYQYFWPKHKEICTLDLYFEIIIVGILASVRYGLFKMWKASHLTIILFYNHGPIFFIMSNACHVVIYIFEIHWYGAHLSLHVRPFPYRTKHLAFIMHINIFFPFDDCCFKLVLTINLVHVHYMSITCSFLLVLIRVRISPCSKLRLLMLLILQLNSWI